MCIRDSPRANEQDNSPITAGDADVTLFTAEHRENLAIAGLLPYRLGAPDVIAVHLIAKDSHGVTTTSVVDELIVTADGTVEHEVSGEFRVDGKTTDEIKKTIETKLRHSGDQRQVEVEIRCRNSKPFYVIVEESDQVTRINCTTNSNVREAIESLDLKIPLAERVIWVSRPQANSNGGQDAVFPIDWNRVSSDMKSADYFPLLPSDRVFVAGKEPIPKFVVSNDEPIPAPYYTAKHPNIQLNVQIIDDTQDSLSEFNELMQHGPMVAMVANTQTTLATLRILEKNNLTKTLAVPAITCRSGQLAKLAMGEFEIQTVATVKDSKMRLEARVCANVKDKTKRAIDTAIEMAANEMTLMKVDDTLYLALTSEVLR